MFFSVALRGWRGEALEAPPTVAEARPAENCAGGILFDCLAVDSVELEGEAARSWVCFWRTFREDGAGEGEGRESMAKFYGRESSRCVKRV